MSRTANIGTPAWRVKVAEHDVPPRWRVERQVLRVCAVDERLRV